MRARAVLPLLVALLVALPATGPQLLAQGDRSKEPPADLPAAKRAVAEWLQSGMADEKLLGKTVAAVLDAGDPALQWFGGELAAAVDPTAAATKGLQAVATHVALGFVERAVATEMVFAGQYEPLRPLMPFVGRLFLQLLLETPDWYPDTFRACLLPPLRDLYPQSPGQRELLGMIRLVENERIEPQDLRRQLALGLYQWGRPEFVQPILDRWRQASGDGSPFDRVEALRMLADLHYQLRQYDKSAATYRLLQALAQKSDVPLRPTDLYASACVHALSGDRERALAAFEGCIELQLSDAVDPSLHIDRKLFERDPELNGLRGSERFQAALRRLPAAEGRPPDRRGKDC